MPEFDSKQYRLTWNTTASDVHSRLEQPDAEVVTSIGSLWWSFYEVDYMPFRNGHLPCDPNGAMLMQGSLSKFWAPSVGRFGETLLMSMFHGNILNLAAGRPAALTKVDFYRQILAEQNG